MEKIYFDKNDLEKLEFYFKSEDLKEIQQLYLAQFTSEIYSSQNPVMTFVKLDTNYEGKMPLNKITIISDEASIGELEKRLGLKKGNILE
jgi:hypothetical protein